MVFARGYAYHCQFKVLPDVAQMKGFDWTIELIDKMEGVRRIELEERLHGCSNWGLRTRELEEQKYCLRAYVPPKKIRDVCEDKCVVLDIRLIDTACK
jgi:hypothetical protein